MDQNACRNKRRELNVLATDWISGLPEEILIHIISLLTMKEAARTSIVSRRWRYLWTHLNRFDFDGITDPKKIYTSVLYDDLILEYIDWVNQVFASTKATRIVEFRISYYLDKNNANDIDKWLEKAVKMGAEKIELYLPHSSYADPKLSIGYTIVDDFFVKRPCVSSAAKILKSLNLNCVNISGELVEYMLDKFRHLEQLFIRESDHLRSVKVSGESLPLRCLKILYCADFSNLDILCAPNLVSLEYKGEAIKMQIRNTPLLSELYIGGELNVPLNFAFTPQITSCLSQITSLKLEMDLSKENMKFSQPLKLTSLKELIVNFTGKHPTHFLCLYSLMASAPFLEKMRLEIAHYSPPYISYYRSPGIEKISHIYPSLKVLEMAWFKGEMHEFEFIRHVRKAAVSLELITIEPHYYWQEKDKYTHNPALLFSEEHSPLEINVTIL